MSESELGSILQFATVYQELHQAILSSLRILWQWDTELLPSAGMPVWVLERILSPQGH